MARGFNAVYLVGTLTKKPELRYTAGGLAILELNVAGSDHVVGDDGQERQLAWYHRVSVFAKQAEYLVDQLEQGSPVFVDGRLSYRSWEDNNTGQRRSSLDVKGIRVDVLGYGPRGNEPTVADSIGQPRLLNALNEAMVIGNLTRDSELRYTPSGVAVTRLSLAVNEQYRDRSGNQQENVHYVDIQVWRSLAESCADLKKGDPLMAKGRLVNDSWTDQEGNKRYATRIEGSRIEFLTRGPSGGGTATRSAASVAAAPVVATSAPTAAPSAPVASAQPSQSLDIDEDFNAEFPPEEELPF